MGGACFVPYNGKTEAPFVLIVFPYCWPIVDVGGGIRWRMIGGGGARICVAENFLDCSVTWPTTYCDWWVFLVGRYYK